MSQKIKFSRVVAAAVTAALVSVSLLTTSGTANAGTVVPGGCSNVAVLGARGSGQEFNSGIRGFGSQAGAAAKALTAALPAKTTVAYWANPYPAADATKVASDTYWTGVRKGVELQKALIAALKRDCPQTKVVLVGYSQGAQVTHYTAVTLTATQASQVKAVVLLADPLRDRSDSRVRLVDWDGKADNNGSLYYEGVIKKMPSHMAGKVLSACYYKDRICNSSQSFYSDLASAFWDVDEHTKPYAWARIAGPSGRWASTLLTK